MPAQAGGGEGEGEGGEEEQGEGEEGDALHGGKDEARTGQGPARA